MFKDSASNGPPPSDSEGLQKKKKKKGFQKLGSTIRFAFGGNGKKRRRKKRKDGTDSSQSEDDSNSYSTHSKGDVKGVGGGGSGNGTGFLQPDGSPNTAAQQEWISGTGGNGLAEMAAIGGTNNTKRINSVGGRGKSLSKITEEEGEEASSTSDLMREAANFDKKRRVSNRAGGGASPSASASSRSSMSMFGGWRSNKAVAQTPADPLSLVVLLVDPRSLRFELLSLDFDLSSGGKKKRRSNKEPQDLDLTVKDVLDQIGPSALTDQKLKERVASPGSCKGLIDRKGQIHFGAASLERSCSARPLRAVDKALQKSNVGNNDNNSNSNSNIIINKRGSGLLSVPTYGGEPHRDVLLGFFGDDADGSSISQETMAAVAKALELARPIFADPNVINLMENSGFNLSGWKPSPEDANHSVASVSETKLGKPVHKPNAKKNKQGVIVSSIQTIVKVLSVLMSATALAWSLVSGGLHLLPGEVVSSLAGGGSGDGDYPVTLEGLIAQGFNLTRSWYFSENALEVTEAMMDEIPNLASYSFPFLGKPVQ